MNVKRTNVFITPSKERVLLRAYAMCDSASSFAIVGPDELLNELTSSAHPK